MNLRKICRSSLLLVAAFLTATAANAAVPRVHEGQSIQAAIDSADPFGADEIIVGPGTYPELLNLGGKVLVPTSQFVNTLSAARLAADVMNVPTVLIARTDANAATLLTSDIDDRDKPFTTGERTVEGFHVVNAGLDQAISRGLAYAPYADVIWCETSHPDLEEAKRFAEAIHEKFPGKLLAYNNSPSFNWRKNLDDATIAKFQRELGAMGYKFQFVTLAGFHALNHSMFELARGYKERHMSAYADLQDSEFVSEAHGYTATRHQREVGTGYFDVVRNVLTHGETSTGALEGSTEAEQFTPNPLKAA